MAREFLREVVKQAQEKDLTSDEHFTVDGTLIDCRVRSGEAGRRSLSLTRNSRRRTKSSER